jgi:hypothetical protein
VRQRSTNRYLAGNTTARRQTGRRQAGRIADAIVDLVERSGGPITLAQIDREVPGFAEMDPTAPSWCWGEEESFFWSGMTRQGCEALRAVLLGRRVALQPASPLVYLLHGRYSDDQNWVPIALVPAAMAKLRTSRLLISGPEEVLKQLEDLATAKQAPGFQRINRAA